jgi:hypothetical protein
LIWDESVERVKPAERRRERKERPPPRERSFSENVHVSFKNLFKPFFPHLGSSSFSQPDLDWY